ncbi:MAG: DNA polymerase III subunit beta [Parcubacteria group bacterium Gr01-1014_72]|nr:MAG: DNA polymerase III subunit beta [Parcubacteria group bacterium Gr01-1014_72]
MKIECLKDKLLHAVIKADRIAGKKHSLPVLNCLVFEASGGSLSIRATNLDLGIETSLPVKIIQEGSVAVSGSVVSSFLSNLPSSTLLSFEVKEGNLFISSGRGGSKALIKAIPHDDFPTIPKPEGKKIVIEAQALRKGFQSVCFAASASVVKPELASVFVSIGNGEIVFAATDSFRLAEKRIPLKGGEGGESFLVPLRNAAEILRFLDDVSGTVELRFSKNQLSITGENFHLTSRLIEGVFPDYKQIIPKETTTEAVCLREDVLQTLKLVNVFSNTFNQITLFFDPPKKLFEARTKNADIGESSQSVAAAVRGDTLELNFNYHYLIDSLQPIQTDSVSLSLSGAGRPMIVRGVSDGSFLYLVMPMNK